MEREAMALWLLAAAGLLVGCSQSAVGANDGADGFVAIDGTDYNPLCDPANYGFGQIEPPMPSSMPVWVDRGVPFERPDPGQLKIQFWLPWDLNSKAVYPMAMEGQFHLRLRSMLGPNFESQLPTRVWAFVDGKQVPIKTDQGVTADYEFTVQDGLDDRQLAIDGSAFHSGLNTLHVIVQYRHMAWVPDLASQAFSVVVGGQPVAPPLLDTPATVSPGFDPGWQTRVFSDVPGLGHVETAGSDSVPPDGVLPIELVLQPSPLTLACGDSESYDAFAVVGVLDGYQMPLGPYDLVRATLRDGEQRRVAFALHVPVDGQPHDMLVLALSGIGRPARLRRDPGIPIWSPPALVVARWRWQ